MMYLSSSHLRSERLSIFWQMKSQIWSMVVRLSSNILPYVLHLIHAWNLAHGLQKAYTTTKIIFGRSYGALTAPEITSAFAGDPRLVYCENSELFSCPVTHLAAAYELSSSKCKFGPSCNSVCFTDMVGNDRS